MAVGRKVGSVDGPDGQKVGSSVGDGDQLEMIIMNPLLVTEESLVK